MLRRWFKRATSKAPAAGEPAPSERERLELALAEPEGHLSVVFDIAQQPRSALYDHATQRLTSWPPRLWLRLDAARLDAWRLYGGELKPTRGWRSSFSDAPTLLVVLGSTHRDGFIREAATRVLAERSDQIAAAALAVRTSDHVAQVAEVARAALLRRSPDGEAPIVVPILYAASARKKAGDFFALYVGRLAQGTLRALTASPDRETRRFAAQHAPLSVRELVDVSATDADTHTRLIAARRALAEQPTIAAELLELRPATVRALALRHAPDDIVLSQLDTLLLDRSALLRRAAQARALEGGYDVRSLYVSSLPRTTAVLGLGESGKPEDAQLLTQFVDGDLAPAVRRAAVIGLGRLASQEVLRAMLPPLLDDDEPAVAREASRQLRRIRFVLAGRDLAGALESPRVWTRQAALGMAVAVRGWDVPVAALTLYDDEDESLREYARAALGSWLARWAPTAGNPTPEQGERLRDLLARPTVPAHVARSVGFHAGIRD